MRLDWLLVGVLHAVLHVQYTFSSSRARVWLYCITCFRTPLLCVLSVLSLSVLFCCSGRGLEVGRRVFKGLWLLLLLLVVVWLL